MRENIGFFSVWLILLHMILYFLTNEEKKFYDFIFIYVYVCTRACACMPCVSCPWRPEEGVRPLELML